MDSTIAELNRRFGISGVVQLMEGNGGLPKVGVNSAEGSGEIYLHGAHVTSWKPTGAGEVFFLSAKSRWADGSAIRGGVPICFPWFATKADDPKAPSHGFVRTKAWQLESVTQTENAVTVSLFTESDENTKKWWAGDFRLNYRASFGPSLKLELEMVNTGNATLRFEEALHSYHRVGDVESVRVQGLDAVHYYDKTDANREKIQHGDIVITSETDRVYLNTEHVIEVEDPQLRRGIRVTKRNSRSTVVWNPWTLKAEAMSDFVASEWKEMVCIETSNVAQFAIELAPQESHTMTATVEVVAL